MQRLVRGMSADDWRIFQSYARRVRDINSSGLDGTHEIDIEIFRALCCPPTQGPLFPNLVSLTWEDRRNEAVPFLRYFLTPSLLHMIWNQHGGPEITRISLLPSIRSICPHMTEAILWSKDSSEQLAKATSDLICGWDLLESLMCGALSEEGWVHLASIPTLRVLKIGIGSLAFTPALLHSTAELRQAFSALEELFLYTGALDAHTSLITLMQHAPLKSIICSPSVPWTSKQLQTLVESLCNGVTGNTLQKFTLKRDNQLEESIHPGADHIAPIGAFRPLFRFCNLTNISVASLGGFDWENADLEEMSSHFPQLQSLDMDTTHGCWTHSKITLTGLVPLLRNCPHLRWLGIVIDATILPPDTEKPRGYAGKVGVWNRHLKSLVLGDSKIDDAARVAAFLSDIVPYVNHIFSWIGDDDDQPPEQREYCERWDEAASLIKVFADVRKQEMV